MSGDVMGLKIAVKDFLTEWGIDPTVRSGGLDQAREIPEERREVTDLLMIDSFFSPIEGLSVATEIWKVWCWLRENNR